MGQADAARVDVPALLGVARQYQDSAEIVDGAVRTHLSALTFDGAAAGRAYVARGDAVHSAVERIAVSLRQWSRACGEIAVTLRASADRYLDADALAARRLG